MLPVIFSSLPRSERKLLFSDTLLAGVRVSIFNRSAQKRSKIMSTTMSKRKALCVGINQFKNYPGAALQGCVNDANDMSELLRKFLGFQSSDITLLHDGQATKANIMSNLKEMVDGAKAGKYVSLVFSMSSHGTQVPDLN